MDFTNLEERKTDIKLLKLSSVAGYTIYDRNTNEGICKPNIHSLSYIIVDYIHKQTQHLLRMNDTQISKLEHEYTPTTRRQNKGWQNQTHEDRKSLERLTLCSWQWHSVAERIDSPVNWTHDLESNQHSLLVLGRTYGHLVTKVTSAPSLCLSKLWHAKHCSGLGTQGLILYFGYGNATY